MPTRVVLGLALALAVGGGLAAFALGEDDVRPIPPPRDSARAPTDGASSPGAPPPPFGSAAEQIEPPVRLTCTSPEQELNFPNYWAGRTFDGLTVGAVIRYCAPPRDDESVRPNYVSYLYGDCTPGLDGGCPAPIEVQTWPAVERNKATLASFLPATDTTVSGVAATWYEGGHRLEIYHPDATIVIFGDQRARIQRFAMALVEGPSVLTDLADLGIVFDDGCVSDAHYCVAEG